MIASSGNDRPRSHSSSVLVRRIRRSEVYRAFKQAERKFIGGPTDPEISEPAHDLAQRLYQKVTWRASFWRARQSVMHGWWIACANYNPSRKVVSEIGYKIERLKALQDGLASRPQQF